MRWQDHGERPGSFLGGNYPFLDADMDITATHCNGNPLRLDDLLNADAFQFAHDIGGIRRHLNRETGKLEDCFVPRFTVREKAAA